MSQKIYMQMAKILASVGSVGKEKTSVGKFSFKYRSIDDVMNELHQAFAEHGVFLTHCILEHKMTPIEGRGIHHIAKYGFTFYADDGSSVACEAMGECIENGDKGLGKTASYALKTVLLQTFLIPTEDDSKDPDSSNKPIYEQKKHPMSAPVQPAQPVDPLRELRIDVYNKMKELSSLVDIKDIFPERILLNEIKSGSEQSLLELKHNLVEYYKTCEGQKK
jgi:hypothetical protein